MTRSRSTAVRVTATTSLPRERVWDVLADANTWWAWVQGTATVRAATPDWPAPGAELHHTWGPWPLRLRDRTTVVRSEPPAALDLVARVRPLAVARVAITLSPLGRGTRVAIVEDVVAGMARSLPPVARSVQRWRNRRSLYALLRLAACRATDRS